MGRRMLVVGLATEGETDIRFLNDIVLRSIEHLVYTECGQDVDIFINPIRAEKGETFGDYVRNSIRKGVEEFGMMALAMHSDSDKDSYEERFRHKFTPVFESLKDHPAGCDILIPIIPVRMTEAWMLADKELFKEEIGSDDTDAELGLDKRPEAITDPKMLIENDLRMLAQKRSRKYDSVAISELYDILGSKVSVGKLSSLPSFIKFLDSVRDALTVLGYLNPSRSRN